MLSFSPVADGRQSTRILARRYPKPSLRVLLLPDLDGNVEESDWELIEADAESLKQRIEV